MRCTVTTLPIGGIILLSVISMVPMSEGAVAGEAVWDLRAIDTMEARFTSEFEGSEASLMRGWMDSDSDGRLTTSEVKDFENDMVEFSASFAEQGGVEPVVHLDGEGVVGLISDYDFDGAEGQTDSEAPFTGSYTEMYTFDSVDKNAASHTLTTTYFGEGTEYRFQLSVPKGYTVTGVSGLTDKEFSGRTASGNTQVNGIIKITFKEDPEEVSSGGSVNSDGGGIIPGLSNAVSLTLISIVIAIAAAAGGAGAYISVRRKRGENQGSGPPASSSGAGLDPYGRQGQYGYAGGPGQGHGGPGGGAQYQSGYGGGNGYSQQGYGAQQQYPQPGQAASNQYGAYPQGAQPSQQVGGQGPQVEHYYGGYYGEDTTVITESTGGYDPSPMGIAQRRQKLQYQEYWYEEEVPP